MNALQVSNLDNFKTQSVYLSEELSKITEKISQKKQGYFGNPINEFDLPTQGFKTGIEREDISINRSFPNIHKGITVLRAKNAVVLWLKNESKSSFKLAEKQPSQGQYSTQKEVFEVVIFKIDPAKPFHVRLNVWGLNFEKEMVFKG